MGIGSLEKKVFVLFAASTVPSRKICQIIDQFESRILIVASSSLAASYRKMLEPRKIRIVSVSKHSTLAFIQTLIFLMAVKLLRKKIVFFHEGFWMSLDLSILLIRPKGFFSPQLPHVGWRKISDYKEVYQVNKNKSYPWIRNHILKIFFDLYEHKNDNADGFLYANIVKRYPKSIIKSDLVQDECDSRFLSYTAKNCVIFLLGSDTVEPEELSQAYMRVMEVFHEMGFKIFIKNHPNPEMRLILDSPLISREIEASIPAEAIVENFEWAVSAGSAALRLFGASAISILNLCPEMEGALREDRKAYLLELDSRINIPISLEELQDVIRL